MKAIVIDIKYWDGVQGDNPSRIILQDPKTMVIDMRRLLHDPAVQGLQVTVEKTNSMEF
jgi:hypothetical protein